MVSRPSLMYQITGGIVVIVLALVFNCAALYKINVTPADYVSEKSYGGSLAFKKNTEDDDGAPRYVVFCGTRPEIIKTAPVVIALKEANMPVHVVFTGQHPDIAAPFQKFWDIQFDTTLGGVFHQGQSLPSLTGNLIMQIEHAISPKKSDVWIVQGDTSTAFAASSVAMLRQIPVVHLEAGLRTYDHSSPFPEEFHRRATALASSLHIAPTELARARLLREGVDPKRVFVMGNSGMDATRLAQPHLLPPAELKMPWPMRLVLVTLHRRENAAHLQEFYQVMGEMNASNLTFVVPVHPNPAATKAATMACAKYESMLCVKPLGYGETHWMMKHADLVVTDSGGLQEEATWYGRPVLVLRTTTERPEAIFAGSSLLVPNAMALRNILPGLVREPNSDQLHAMQIFSYPFGKGHTSTLLVDLLKKDSTKALLVDPIRMIGDNDGHDKGSQSIMTKQDRLPHCSEAAVWQECTDDSGSTTASVPSIDVFMTVYKRSQSLPRQLDALVKQSIKPTNVWIMQNENHADVVEILKKWRKKQKGNDAAIPPIDIVTSSSNTRFHGRFHLAYALSSATYVAIWDDDILPGIDWLKYNIEFSRSHDNCLVGGNGRTILKMVPERHCVQQGGEEVQAQGLADFVGHSWTLRREYLRFYLGMQPLTYETGEDIQLAFALQRHGIASYSPPQSGTRALKDVEFLYQDDNASWKKPQHSRQWLLCKVIQEGFQPVNCENCTPENAHICLSNFSTYEDFEWEETILQAKNGRHVGICTLNSTKA